MSSNSPRRRLPFEPGKKRSKSAKKAASPRSRSAETPAGDRVDPMPEVVGQRILARMAVLSVTPTLLGILTMVGSYFIVTKNWFPLPHAAVVLTSAGFFGLGVLGLSYGALSASWDEDKPGSLFGMSEFKINLGRAIAVWKQPRSHQQAGQDGGKQ